MCEIRTYRIRWVLLAGICVGSFLRQIDRSILAVGNRNLVQYFEVPAYYIDMAITGDSVIGGIICFIIAVLGGRFGARIQCLMLSGGIAVADLLVSVSFFSRNTFWILGLGRIIASMTTGILHTVAIEFANRWFPKDEIATVIALTFLSVYWGGVATTVAISNTLPKPIQDFQINGTNVDVDENFDRIRRVFFLFTVVSSVSSLIITVFFFFEAKDKPPKPPSKAEAFLIMEQEAHQRKFELISKLREVLDIIIKPEFSILNLAGALGQSGIVATCALLPSILSASFPNMSNEVIGAIVSVTLVFAGLGSVASGKILDRSHAYKPVTFWGGVLALVTGIVICFGHLYRVTALLAILYPVFIFLVAVARVANLEFLTEITYPLVKTQIMALYYAFGNIVYMPLALLGRLALSEFGPAGAIIFVIITNIVTLGLVLAVKPDYKRTLANALDKRSSETDFLLEK